MNDLPFSKRTKKCALTVTRYMLGTTGIPSGCTSTRFTTCNEMDDANTWPETRTGLSRDRDRWRCGFWPVFIMCVFFFVGEVLFLKCLSVFWGWKKLVFGLMILGISTAQKNFSCLMILGSTGFPGKPELFIFSGALGHMCWVVFLGMFWGDVGRRQTIGRWEQGMILSFKQCDEEVFTCYEYGG